MTDDRDQEREDALRALRDHSDALKAEHGFVIHYTQARPDDDRNLIGGQTVAANYHTHGFRETWQHEDLQIVFPLRPEVAHGIFWAFANRVRDGESFFADRDYLGLLGGGMRVKLINRVEGDRSVLRILLPDAQGLLPGEQGCDPTFNTQPDVVTAEV